MPALEALVGRLEAAHTQPLAISVDSVHCHANWAESLGGISLPLLSDFHPKGALAEAFGLYLADKGITDRATVIVDADGIVRHASSVTPAGSRDIAELAALCEQIDRDHAKPLAATEPAPGLEPGAELFVKNGCGFSRAALLAVANLHLKDAVRIRNVSEDTEAAAELEKRSGKGQAPALIIGSEAMLESTAIIRHLVTKTVGLWP